MNRPFTKLTAQLSFSSPTSSLFIREASALFLLLVIAFTPLGQSVEALTMAPLSIETLSRDADLIIHGRVLSQEAERVQKAGAQRGGAWIFTVSALNVTTRLKGDCPKQILVSQAGGTIDGLTMSIPGATLLAPDQEVVLFLRAKPETSRYTILGFNQGIRWVKLNLEGQREVLKTPKRDRHKNSASSSPLSESSPEGSTRTRRIKIRPQVKALNRSRPLEAFMGEIRLALEGT